MIRYLAIIILYIWQVKKKQMENNKKKKSSIVNKVKKVYNDTHLNYELK